MRPIISYDDIAIPQSAEPPVPPKHHTNSPSVQPPAKKRRTGPNHQQGNSWNGRTGQSMQHWDDPGNQGMAMSYDDAPSPVATKATAAEEEYDDEEEESRELSHEEIWDDSALIDAWNSAAAEYEVCSSTPTTAAGVTKMHDFAPRHSMVRVRSGRKNRSKSLLCASLYAMFFRSAQFRTIRQ